MKTNLVFKLFDFDSEVGLTGESKVIKELSSEEYTYPIQIDSTVIVEDKEYMVMGITHDIVNNKTNLELLTVDEYLEFEDLMDKLENL